jgi:hypothetical protein
MSIHRPRQPWPILLLVLFSVGAHEVTAPVERDWKQYPAIVTAPAPKILYAMGDVHGDYQKMIELLVAGKLIAGTPARPEAIQWAGADAVLVCTGDLIDKYSQNLNVIAAIRALQQSAAAAGGEVIVTLGNHEANFLASGGETRKMTDFEQELKAAGISPVAVAEGTDANGIGAWLRNLPAGVKVGSWFFCHAGNTGGKTVSELETTIEKEVSAQGWSAPILANPNSMLEARMHPRPWWDYDGSEPRLKDVDPPETGDQIDQNELSRLKSVVNGVGAAHLVFGHQPSGVKFMDGSERAAGQMYTKYDGLVFLIDTGMSRGVQNGRGALLRIDASAPHPTAVAVYADGATTHLWP